MNRREFLTVAGSIALAGCATDAKPAETTQTARDPTKTARKTVRDGVVHDQIEVNTSESFVQQRAIRYYDEDENDLAMLEPDHGIWVQPGIGIENLGGSPVERSRVVDFRLLVDDKQWMPEQDFPIDWQQVRLRDEMSFTMPDGAVTYGHDEHIEAGGDESYRPLFDVPIPADGRLVLVWHVDDKEYWVGADEVDV